MSKFIVQGGNELSGQVDIGGAKNAALPILAATLLTDQPCTIHNVPDISDVHNFLKILESLGSKVTFEDNTVKVDNSAIQPGEIDDKLVTHMRSSFLLFGPLLGRFKELKLAFPGGCVLGKRSADAHLNALEAFGAKTLENGENIHMKADNLTAAKFIMTEASVTATENAIMAAVMTDGESEIRWAAMEPHVQDLCNFLVTMGAQIEGIGTHTLKITGGKALTGTDYSVTSDYLQAGTFILAGVLTNSEITVNNCPTSQLDSFFQKLEEIGANFTCEEDKVHVKKHNGLKPIKKLQTSVYPGFATDLQAPFAVLLTQCEGTSHVHETLFDGRLGYLDELNKMGANTEILNPHQATINGPTPLKGAHIFSCDIRAGGAMVLASLIADGETVIHDIKYTDRGYEAFDENLRSLGAKIERNSTL